MAKGKSTFITWFCTQCNAPLEISYYKKTNDAAKKDRKKEKKRFCKHCRGHKVARYKETK